jgi:hypothetical protein
MTQIICRASICVFWEQGVCGAEEIEYEPDVGCVTFQDMGDLELADSEEEDLEWEDADGNLLEDDDDWDEDDDDWGSEWGDDERGSSV